MLLQIFKVCASGPNACPQPKSALIKDLCRMLHQSDVASIYRHLARAKDKFTPVAPLSRSRNPQD